MKAIIILASLFLLFRANGQGTILWDEAVDGPLSQDYRFPTALTPFLPGTNSIIGSTELTPTGNNWVTHPDYLTIQLADGLSLGAVFLAVDRPNMWAWIGATNFLGELGFVPSASLGELMTQWHIQAIGPGNYGIYLSNNDPQAFTSVASYRLDFVVVPEPASVWLLLGGLGWLGFRGWTKRHQSHCPGGLICSHLIR